MSVHSGANIESAPSSASRRQRVIAIARSRPATAVSAALWGALIDRDPIGGQRFRP